MRIRLLRQINTSVGELDPGEVLDIDGETARKWIAQGAAMEEKSYRPPKRKKRREKKVKNS